MDSEIERWKETWKSKYSKRLMVESTGWVYGCSLYNSFKFATHLKCFIIKSRGEEEVTAGGSTTRETRGGWEVVDREHKGKKRVGFSQHRGLSRAKLQNARLTWEQAILAKRLS